MTTRTELTTVALMLSAATKPSLPELGKKEGLCHVDERGPALLVSVAGLKDRQGDLKLEVYPANDQDFLADDNVLLGAGKVFRRIELPMSPSGPLNLCIRVPGPSIFAASLLHDRDGNRTFGRTQTASISLPTRSSVGASPRPPRWPSRRAQD